MDFTTNYCGMYWSDGGIRSSVVGTKDPVNELDAQCKEHDASYALNSDPVLLSTADNKFYENTRNLGYRASIYGSLVLNGNKIMRYFVSPTPQNYKPSLRAVDTPRLPVPATRSSDALLPNLGPRTKSQPVDAYTPKPTDQDEYVNFAGASRLLPTTLYKPLNRKNKKIVPMITKKKNKNDAKTKSTTIPPANKNKIFIENTNAPTKTKTPKTHVDQDTCTHPEIRSCYNYKYCSRCNREFH